MGINATPSIAAGNGTQSTPRGASDTSRESQHVKGKSGNDSIPEAPAEQRSSPALELPQDEVHVQRDNQAGGQIVVRYMDHSGNLILQVPSQQVLNVAHAIGQDLQREQKARIDEAVPDNRGGKPDGH